MVSGPPGGPGSNRELSVGPSTPLPARCSRAHAPPSPPARAPPPPPAPDQPGDRGASPAPGKARTRSGGSGDRGAQPRGRRAPGSASRARLRAPLGPAPQKSHLAPPRPPFTRKFCGRRAERGRRGNSKPARWGGALRAVPVPAGKDR